MRLTVLAGTSLLALAASVASAAAAPITFGYTGGFQTFTAPTAGTYDILAFGAGGGRGYDDAPGGSGAEVGGDFVLTLGEVLSIAVGGVGGSVPNGDAGGGGGGSFVVAPGNVPLAIAGGGGGGALDGAVGGQAGTAGSAGFSGSGAGGTNGAGGGSGGYYGGSGGGGFLSNGTGASAGGGGSYLGGLAGGAAAPGGGAGGFGGGGGGDSGGGGGGGYSGGGGGSSGFNGGGGGGSFLAMGVPMNADFVDLGTVRSGYGSVTITLVSATPPTTVPEPAGLSVFAGSLLGLGLLRRWRRT